MLKSLENALAAVAMITVVSSFGLSVVIAAAGISRTSLLPVACHQCLPTAQVAAVTLSPLRS